MKSFSATDLQRLVYLRGISGHKPIIPLRYDQLVKKARVKLSREAFAYIAGGAGSESTIAANRIAFDRWNILPRVLRDVSERNLSIQLLGQKLSAPILLGPIGVLELAHKKADIAVAQAAKDTGIPLILSNQASRPMEECAALMGNSPRWFQLYWSKSDELVKSLLKRAEACGCSAILVTLDTTLLGWRQRDLDLAYLPFLEGRGIAQYTSDPVFQRLIEESEEGNDDLKPSITLKAISTLFRMVRNYPGTGFFKKLRSGKPRKAVQKFIEIYSRPSITWEEISSLRKYTKLPILLKGILHSRDTEMALEAGIDGLIVSNHGGRQVDGAIASIDALPPIMEVVKDDVPVILDSGVRSGADVFKALALGATAVCIGRPYVYALALAGREGVATLVRHLMADFELNMALAGCRNISEVGEASLHNLNG